MVRTPEDIIQAQLEAYNARDVDAFLALHAEDAQLFALPENKLIAAGQAQLRERYSQRFSNPELHATVVQRIVRGNYVIDHEEIVGMTPDAVVKAVAIYELVDEKIQRVWFIFD